MTTTQGIQQAIRFLAALSAAEPCEGVQLDPLKPGFGFADLVRHAAHCGYDLNAEEITAAFRMQMLARELTRRRTSK